MAFVVGELSAPITLDTKGFDKGLSEVNRAGQRAAKQVSDSFKDMGKRMSDVGKSLTKRLTLPIAGIGTATMKIGSDFDSQMSKVQAVSGATGDDLDKLREKAKDMGSETMFSATESAEALEYMALAGWETQEMLDGLPGVLDLAAAGALDLGRASDIVTDGMSMFQMEAEESSRMSDVLAKAQAEANTNVEQLGEAMKMGGASASAAGESIESTSAILGVFADNGFKGSQAGTILDNMFRDVKNSAEDGAIAIGDASIEVYDANGNMRAMSDIMADVEKATEGMSDEARDAALANVFQSRSLRGVNTILGEGTDALYDLEEELKNSEGAAEEMADVMQDNLGGSITEMMSALEGLAISFYELGEGPLRSVVDWVTDLIRKFTDMDDHTKQIIMIVGGLAAALGPLLLVGGALVSSIGALIPVFSALFGPVGLIIGAITALTAGIVYLWNTNEEFREFLGEIWESISEIFTSVISAIVEFVQEIWGGLVEWWQEHNEMIMQAFENFVNFILGLMEFLWPFVEMLVVQTWQAVQDIIQGAIDVITGIIEFFSALFTGDWEALWEATKKILSGAVQALWGLVNTWFIGRILKLGSTFIKSFRDVFSKGWDFIKNLFTSSVNAVRNAVSTGFNAVRNVVSNIMNGIRSVISSVWNSARSTVSSVVNGIRDTISNIFNRLRGIVSNAMSGVHSAVSNGIRNALNAVKNMAKNFFNAGKNIVTSIIDGIKAAPGKITDAIKDMAGAARDFLPFSPAKKGPLKDLDKLDFGGPLEESLQNAIPGVQGKLQTLLQVPQPETSSGDSSPGLTTGDDGAVYEFNIDVPLDGKTIAKKTVKFTAEELENLKRRERRRR